MESGIVHFYYCALGFVLKYRQLATPNQMAPRVANTENVKTIVRKTQRRKTLQLPLNLPFLAVNTRSRCARYWRCYSRKIRQKQAVALPAFKGELHSKSASELSRLRWLLWDMLLIRMCINYIFLETTDFQLQDEEKLLSVSCINWNVTPEKYIENWFWRVLFPPKKSPWMYGVSIRKWTRG